MPLTRQQLEEAVEAFNKTGSETKAAELLGIKRACFQGRIRAARMAGMQAEVDNTKQHITDIPPEIALKDKIRTLEAQIAAFNRDVLS